ncbi:hypothetical protein M1M99_02120 [Thermodesulfovibrionales bacterium]|nr:hypothetical protein [Thermodesulfovibrionales bacterium]
MIQGFTTKKVHGSRVHSLKPYGSVALYGRMDVEQKGSVALYGRRRRGQAPTLPIEFTLNP